MEGAELPEVGWPHPMGTGRSRWGEPLPTCLARAVFVPSDSELPAFQGELSERSPQADSQSGFSSQGASGFLWETEGITKPRAGCDDAPSHLSSLGSQVIQLNKIHNNLN